MRVVSRFPTLNCHEFSMPAWNEVHIWTARLDVTPWEREQLEGSLGDEERQRARRFIHERDRRRYIAGRGILRHLLACYFGLPPEEIAFTYGPYGKPQLAHSLAESGLRFNLSHAGAWALYAIAHCREVGIDLESQHQTLAWQQLAPFVFSEKEQAELAAMPVGQKMEAFLHGWTRKEAYVKGRGDGLSHPLDRFDVPLARMQAPRLVNPTGSGHWWLYPIDCITGYVGALAVEGGPVRLLYHHLTLRPWHAEGAAMNHPTPWEQWPPATAAHKNKNLVLERAQCAI